MASKVQQRITYQGCHNRWGRGRSVNPIWTRGDTLSSPSTTSPLKISDLATALDLVVRDLPYQLGCNHRGDRCAPKLSDTLTLSQPRRADSAHHFRGRSVSGSHLVLSLDSIQKKNHILKKESNLVLIVGKTFGHLYQSVFFEEIYSLFDGPPPEVNLLNERNNGKMVLDLIKKNLVRREAYWVQ